MDDAFALLKVTLTSGLGFFLIVTPFLPYSTPCHGELNLLLLSPIPQGCFE